MWFTTDITALVAGALRLATAAWAVLLPTLSLAVATLFAIVPAGLGDDWRFVPALLPVALAHYWTDRRLTDTDAPALPALLLFASGLAIDAMTNGPLGYWALVYLAASGFAHALGPLMMRAGLHRWVRFVLTMILVAGLAWSIASLYFASPAAVLPIGLAAAVIALAEPIIATVLAAATPATTHRPSFADRRA
ncbi:MAG: hypothetical protein R3D27_11120 [Hyphomicrobiaceae bacterium]